MSYQWFRREPPPQAEPQNAPELMYVVSKRWLETLGLLILHHRRGEAAQMVGEQLKRVPRVLPKACLTEIEDL